MMLISLINTQNENGEEKLKEYVPIDEINKTQFDEICPRRMVYVRTCIKKLMLRISD